MSYRNPKQFVDTQTAQHYRNLQKTMTGITDDYINTIKQKQAAETKRLKEIAKINNERRIKQENYRSKTGQALNNATGDRPDIFKKPEVQGQFINAIDNVNDLMNLPVLNRGQRVYKDNVNGLSKTIVGNLTDLETLGGDYQARAAKKNSMGGISPYNDPSQRAATDSIFSQGIGGKNTFSMDLSQPGGAETKYTHTNDEGETFSFTGSGLREIVADPMREIIVTIPDETTNMQRIANTFGYETDQNGEPTGEIKQRYYEEQKEQFRINEKGDKEYYKTANEELFLQDIKQESIANVEALLRPNQLALWNYFQDTSVDDKKDENGKTLYALDHKFENEEEEQEFLNQLSASYGTYLSGKYFLNNKKVVTRTEKVKQPEPPTEGQRKRKIATETAKTVLKDMFKSPESYFKDRKINGRRVTNVSILPSTVGTGEEQSNILQLEVEAGTSTAKGEKTVFTEDVTFDLSNPARIRSLIDMLPEGDNFKTALKKLITTESINPLLNSNK